MNSASPIGRPSFARLTILVVEDEILVRMTVTDALRRHGFHVAEAKDADEALAILRSGVAVALVIIDPESSGTRDGIRLTAAVRSGYPVVKVVAVASEPVAVDAAGSHVDAFVAKPYDVPGLVHIVKSLLQA